MAKVEIVVGTAVVMEVIVVLIQAPVVTVVRVTGMARGTVVAMAAQV